MSGGERRRTLPGTPTSAGQARRFVESVLTEAGQEGLVYTATMLVSELVANAVLHTRTPIEVVVDPSGERVRIEVYDGSAQLPVRKHYSDLSGTGRGLLLVERIATDWGAERTPTGKVVWCEIDDRAVPFVDLLEVEAF